MSNKQSIKPSLEASAPRVLHEEAERTQSPGRIRSRLVKVGAIATALLSLNASPAAADHEDEGLDGITAFSTCNDEKPEALVGVNIINFSYKYRQFTDMNIPYREEPFTWEQDPRHATQMLGHSEQGAIHGGSINYTVRYEGHENGADLVESGFASYDAISCDGSEPPPVGGPERPIENVYTIAGADRVETAIAISNEHFEQADSIVLATGENYPDALSGGPLAAILDAPLLLNVSGNLDPRLADEIQRLGADNVILLGGENALSAAVEKQLNDLGVSTRRIAGQDRFETSAKVAEEIYSRHDISLDPAETATTIESTHPSEIMLASGLNYADAIAIGALAAREGAPIVLTADTALPHSIRELLEQRQEQIRRVTVVGGFAAVSAAVEDSATVYAAANSSRLAGAERTATSAAVAREDLARQGGGLEYAYIASAFNYPDALTAGPAVAGRPGAVLILVNGHVTEQAAHRPLDEFFRDNKEASTNNLIFIGGKAAISEEVMTVIRFITNSHPDNPDSRQASAVNTRLARNEEVAADGRIDETTDRLVFSRDADGNISEPIVINKQKSNHSPIAA